MTCGIGKFPQNIGLSILRKKYMQGTLSMNKNRHFVAKGCNQHAIKIITKEPVYYIIKLPSM